MCVGVMWCKGRERVFSSSSPSFRFAQILISTKAGRAELKAKEAARRSAKKAEVRYPPSHRMVSLTPHRL
jgi:hypothetical protein